MKSAKELGITRTQRRNLAKLAVRFRDLKPNGYKGTFDMMCYCATGSGEGYEDVEDPKDSREKLTQCGTSGCLLGHAPYLNIGLSSLPEIALLRHYKWARFSELVFGLIEGSSRWDWLFDSDWISDKDHALKRIAWVLEKGFPDKYDFDSCGDDTPNGFESFNPNWEEIEKVAK